MRTTQSTVKASSSRRTRVEDNIETDRESALSARLNEGSCTEASGHDATEDTEWLSQKDSALKRHQCMVNNQLMSDVTFIVSEEKYRIPAHKILLSTGSPVFYAMFYGPLKSNSNEIEVPDVDKDTFLTVVKYLYSDKKDLNGNNVLPTLYASKKYMLPHLSHACIQYLERNLDIDNVCPILSQSRVYEETGLTKRCLELIDRKARAVLASSDFLQIDLETLKCILKRDTLGCSELCVFDAASAWATAQCIRDGMNSEAITGEHRRQVLGEALFMIRFPAMTLQDFSNGPVRSLMLTLDECRDMLLYYGADAKPALGFSKTPREGPSVPNTRIPEKRISSETVSKTPKVMKK